MAGRLFCPICGDVIGVYEPLLIVGGAAARRSSLAREPHLGSAEDVVVHSGCGSGLGSAGADAHGSASAPADAVPDS